MNKVYTFLLISLFPIATMYPYHYVLISAPGSGKGTFSQYMMENHNYELIRKFPTS